MSCSQANIWSEYLYYQHGFSATRLPTHENPHPDLASPSRRVCDDHTKRRLNMCSHQCHTQFFARAGVRRLGRVIVRTTLENSSNPRTRTPPPPPQKKNSRPRTRTRTPPLPSNDDSSNPRTRTRTPPPPPKKNLPDLELELELELELPPPHPLRSRRTMPVQTGIEQFEPPRVNSNPRTRTRTPPSPRGTPRMAVRTRIEQFEPPRGTL